MNLEDTLIEHFAREATTVAPVPDLLERVCRQRGRRSAQLRALAVGTLVVLMAVGVSLAVARSRPTATPAPAATSTTAAPSASKSSSRPPTPLTVRDQRLVRPFVYPGSSLSLSPVPI